MVKEVDSVKLIDKYLPCWNFAKSNQIQLNNKDIPDISNMNDVDFAKSKIIKILFLLRGLSTKKLSLNNALRSGFILLDQNNDEIVLGLIAQPWKFKGNILHTTPEVFSQFDQSDYIKVAWNFRVEKKLEDLYLTTETRIYCTSKSAQKKFSFYWLIISFFSGVIRKEMLKIKRNYVSKSRG